MSCQAWAGQGCRLLLVLKQNSGHFWEGPMALMSSWVSMGLGRGCHAGGTSLGPHRLSPPS